MTRELTTTLLDTMSAEEISELDVQQLAEFSEQVTAMCGRAQEIKEKLETAFLLRFWEKAERELGDDFKETGTARFFEGACEIVAKVPKRVSWDSEKMEKLVCRLSDKERRAFVKTSYAIEERKYSALPNEYRAMFADARTVTQGKPKIQINLNA